MSENGEPNGAAWGILVPWNYIRPRGWPHTYIPDAETMAKADLRPLEMPSCAGAMIHGWCAAAVTQRITSMRSPMPPRALFIDRIESPIGTMLLIHDPQEHVRALDFHDFEARMQRLLRLHYGRDGGDFVVTSRKAPAAIRQALVRYFAGDLAAIDHVPVATGGTAFQREVWTALRSIRPGITLSYGALAQKLGRPKSVRAVGLANGANPIAVVVPCHRVIGADASLTGYGGGIGRKRWLLIHEGAAFREIAPRQTRRAA
jgi:methylated-DNA-[protein]-cysteine S-methyltransferase